MPEFRLPHVDLPHVDLSGLDLEKAAADLGQAAKEAAYAAVGFGVLGFQRAQVHRVELTKQLSGQLGDLAKSVEEALAPVRQELDARLDGIEERLPSPADEMLHTLRETAGAGERALRAVVRPRS